MEGRTLEPARPEQLRWLAPESASEESFRAVRARLGALIEKPRGGEVYSAKRRSIYHVEDEILGAVAIKEIRSENPIRRARFGFFQQHPAIREFRVGCGFEARGGRTPSLLGAAQERSSAGLDRVFLFIRWLDDATPVSDRFDPGDPPDFKVLDRIAGCMVRAARQGLVHGRHSPQNLLAVGDDPDYYVIDFAYSRLSKGFDPRGFIADAARMGVCLTALRMGEDTVGAFFDRVASLAWPDSDEAKRARRALRFEFEQW